jgi:hypothetical protein
VAQRAQPLDQGEELRPLRPAWPAAVQSFGRAQM